MVDRFIDKSETKIYGEYAVKKIKSSVVGLVPPLDAGLKHVASELGKATKAVAAAVASAHDADTSIRKRAQDKAPALAAALDLLKRFSAHLDTHAAGAVDRRAFFLPDGTVTGIGRSVIKVVAALDHVAAQLGKKNKVKNAKGWSTEIKAARAALSPAAAGADAARTARSKATPDVEAARAEWLFVYGATKLIVEGVLRLSGKPELMRDVFQDLAVATPKPKKKKAAPAPAAKAPAAATATPAKADGAPADPPKAPSAPAGAP